jgi:hypothetical protein
MAAVNNIYVLKPVLNDPRFRGFVFGPEKTSRLGLEHVLYDFDPENPMSINWQPRRLSPVWRPLEVEGDVAPFNDYPCLELATPVFSQRAAEVLGEMLSNNGELLPLITKSGDYLAFNLLTKLDALDLTKSKVNRSKQDEIGTYIHYFAFRKAKLKGASVFRVPEHHGFILVTDQFKERAEAAGLNGMDFSPVWPLPENVMWRQEKAARDKKSKTIRLSGQALILRLRLKSSSPDTGEKVMAEEIRSSLDSVLKVESLSDPYRGMIEVSEFEDGEFRIFCSCPDCEELADHLADWVAKVVWDSDFDIVKRYGNLYDQKAKEKRVSIRNASPS